MIVDTFVVVGSVVEEEEEELEVGIAGTSNNCNLLSSPAVNIQR